MQLAFYFDQSRCIGCNTCVVACKDWNLVPPGPASWRRLEVTEEGVFPEVAVYNMLLYCYHCRQPTCVKVCRANAISKDPETGVVTVDRSRCTGARRCLSACPFNAPQFGDNGSEPDRQEIWQTDHPMQKCEFCLDRVREGRRPACVDACLVRALDSGTEDEIKKRYPEAVPRAMGLPDPKGTKPAIYFKPKKAARV
jgi:anaerobic dimethyl sulfoxide reductase subunit B (iron-sulfur subunit)